MKRFKLALFLCAVAVACSSAKPPRDSGGRPARVESPALPPATASRLQTPEREPSKVEEPAPSVPHPAAASEPAPEKGHDLRSEALRTRIAREPEFKKAMTDSLDKRGWEFFFSTPDRPSSAVDLLISAVKALPDHGRTTEGYPIEALEEAARRIPALAAAAAGSSDPSSDAARALLAGRAELEILASVTFFRYALDMKFLIRANPFKADRDPSRADIVHLSELVGAFEAFAKDPAAGLDSFIPKHPYYAKTQAALVQYRKYVAAGGFTPITFKGKLKKGARGPDVKALRERLAQEGYQVGHGETFDTALESAVKEYQERHGYDPTGVLEERHLKSINVPAEQRVKQIELSLRRWHESEVRPEEPLYIRVNLAEFKMEVWENGAIWQKHKIVCGSNEPDKDPINRLEGRINRSKMLAAKIEKIVINPKWHVPGRIQKTEIDFELLKDPAYLKRHNYKVRVFPDGREEMYQDSGGGNALGRVKFSFTNPYGIYMHDTPLKEFFKREIRAFSHGCIRLQNPLEVAFFLLERRANLKQEEVQALLDAGEEKDVPLDVPVPIFIEYNSVGIDEKGRVAFYSDVYGFDRDFWDGKIPYSEAELRILKGKVRGD